MAARKPCGIRLAGVLVLAIFSIGGGWSANAGADSRAKGTEGPSVPIEGSAVYVTGPCTQMPCHGDGALGVNGGSGDSDVLVRFDSATNEFVVTDLAGAVVFYPGAPSTEVPCEPESPTTVRCDAVAPHLGISSGGGRDSVRVDPSVALLRGTVFIQGGGGPDAITIAPDFRSSVTTDIHGNAGDDRIRGGGSRDLIQGIDGDDELFGRGGRDALFGAGGHDRLLGGPGGDVLDAVRNDRDQDIRCGPGDDRARIDRGVDPAPEQCEETRRS